jgi:hypothetical protein
MFTWPPAGTYPILFDNEFLQFSSDLQRFIDYKQSDQQGYEEGNKKRLNCF